MSGAADLSTFRKRDAWICRAIGDASLSAFVRLVAARLALHHNCAAGQCNPAYSTIGKELSVSGRSIMRAVTVLEARGWIAVERSAGGRHDSTNNFNFLECPMTGDSTLSPVKASTGDNSLSRVTSRSRVTAQALTGDKSSKGRVTPAVTQNSVKKNSEENSDDRLALAADLFPPNDAPAPRAAKTKKANAAVLNAAFESFWAVYPKRVAKAKARRAFAAALKRANAETIMAGASRFAVERKGEDVHYTPHPATWLNDDRWADEPAAVNGAPILDERGNPIEQPRRRQSGLKPSALSMVFPGRRQ